LVEGHFSDGRKNVDRSLGRQKLKMFLVIEEVLRRNALQRRSKRQQRVVRRPRIIYIWTEEDIKIARIANEAMR
jgi:hypothetical protein